MTCLNKKFQIKGLIEETNVDGAGRRDYVPLPFSVITRLSRNPAFPLEIAPATI